MNLSGAHDVRRLVPGVTLLCFGALVASLLGPVVGLNELLAAIILGFLVTNTVSVPAIAEDGVNTHSRWLKIGIVLMGASLTIEAVIEAGALVLVLVLGVTAFTVVLVESVARNVFGLTDKLSSLLAAGASICGVSAVVAVAGAIRAREEQIAYAAATILLFDAITIVVYPIISSVLDLSSTVFGIWAGISMFSTGPVVAVGFAHSEAAGQWAMITKLTRNALIGLVVVAYASFYARSKQAESLSLRAIWRNFPTFVIGFIVLMVITSTGLLSDGVRTTIGDASHWLFMIAFVGIGSEIRLRQLRQTGTAPVLVILLCLAVSSVLTLAVLLALLG